MRDFCRSFYCDNESVDIYTPADPARSRQMYAILIACTAAYCALAAAVLALSAVWPISVYLPATLLITQALSVVHALTQKHLCATVQLVHQYYAVTVGLLYGAATTACAIFLLCAGWSAANPVLKCIFVIQLCLGVHWMYMWFAILMFRVLRKSRIQNQGGDDFSVFLLLRCACVPSDSKKMFFYTPLFFLGIFFCIESFLTRSLTCHVPLQSFCLVAGVLFLLLGVLSFFLLNIRREATSLDLVRPADEVLLVPRLTSAFGLLTSLRIACLFGLVWASIGVDWTMTTSSGCDDRIKQVAVFGYHALFLTCFGGLFFSVCCKLEACFPVRLDPKMFESDDRAESARSVVDFPKTNSGGPLCRLLTMYVGFIVANPDWYEAEEYGGWTNLLFDKQDLA